MKKYKIAILYNDKVISKFYTNDYKHYKDILKKHCFKLYEYNEKYNQYYCIGIY